MHQVVLFNIVGNYLIAYLYGNFLPSLDSLFTNLNLIFMNILNYIMSRSNKFIDDEITPICSPHPSESQYLQQPYQTASQHCL